MSDFYKVSELKAHPKNDYFFDDISGDAWNEFLKSVKTSGIIEPLVITGDKVVVSGHQRLRAAKELGMEQVQCEVKIYKSEEEILKQLIETNLRQRGLGNVNPIKLGRCLKELEKIEGIRNGGDRKSEPNYSVLIKTQDDLARELGVSKDTIQNYKRLADATPALQEIVEVGKITPTSALKIIRSLSPKEQEEIASQIGSADNKFTGKQVEALIAELKEENRVLKEANEKLEDDIRGFEASDESEDEDELLEVKEQLAKMLEANKALKEEVKVLKNKEPETVTVEKEVIVHADQKEIAEKDARIKELEEQLAKAQEEPEEEVFPDLDSPKKTFEFFISAYEKFNSTAAFFQPSKNGFESLDKATRKHFYSIIAQMEGLLEKMKACSAKEEK